MKLNQDTPVNAIVPNKKATPTDNAKFVKLLGLIKAVGGIDFGLPFILYWRDAYYCVFTALANTQRWEMVRTLSSSRQGGAAGNDREYYTTHHSHRQYLIFRQPFTSRLPVNIRRSEMATRV